MRKTLILDKDVAAMLELESRHSGRTRREIVNEALRRGLQPSTPPRRLFRVRSRDMGAMRSGVSFDNVAVVVESLEGPLAR